MFTGFETIAEENKFVDSMNELELNFKNEETNSKINNE